MNGERSALSESDAPAEAAQATPDGASNGVPVFVMLPLDSVSLKARQNTFHIKLQRATACIALAIAHSLLRLRIMDRNHIVLQRLESFSICVLLQVTSTGKFRYANSKWFARALASLVCTGVRGVAIDVWVSATHHPL